MQKLYWLFFIVFNTSYSLASDEVLQFHTIELAGAGKITTNIAPHGLRKDGSIIAQYNPNSIIYQHKKMMEAMIKENELLLLEAELSQTQAQSLLSQKNTAVPGNLFLNRRSNHTVLQELIDLEKRAGRAKAKSR